MKKIIFLFSLLLTFLGVSSAWAQKFRVSDAPNGSDWGTHTYWYTIKNGSSNGYVSTSNADANGMTLKTTTLSNTDEEKWCVVGSEAEGYRFYNKAAGTGKVLGITNKNNSDYYGSSRANMVDYTSTSVSSTADNEVGFTFIRVNSSYDSHYEAFKLAGIEGNFQRYINNRETANYLSYWNHNNVTQGTSSGSSFLFTPVDEYEKALFDAKMKLEEVSAETVGYPFCTTQESYEAALATYNTYKDQTQYTIGDKRNAAISALNGITFTKQALTDGMQVVLGNKLHTNRYVYVKNNSSKYKTEGMYLGSGTAKDSYRYLFTFKAAGDGKFKIYSNYFNSYVGAIPTKNDFEFKLVDEANAQVYTVAESSNFPGYANIYDADYTTTSGDVLVNALHMVDWDGVVRWGLDVNASAFRFIPASKFQAAWDAAIIKNVNTEGYVGYKAYTSEVASALNTFKTASAETKASAYKALEGVLSAGGELVKPVAGKYYTIENACSDNSNKFIIENYGVVTENSENQLVAKSYEKNIVPALWKFEQLTTEGKTDLYHIIAANSGKCMSKTVYGYTMHVTDADNTNVGEFNLFNKDHVSKDFAVTLVTYTNSNRSDRGTASMDNGGGAIKSWNAIDNNNNWRIKEVTTIPVNITSAGYATLNLPMAVNIPTGVKAYTGQKEGNELKLTAITTGIIPAETPVVIEGAEGTHNFDINYDNTATIANNGLNGTLIPTAIDNDATAYVLGNGSKGIAFYKVTSETDRTIGANKAYAGSTTVDAAANVLIFNFSDITTGINNAATTQGNNNTYYDLNGRRVLYPAHGIFVKENGQKVFIK